MRGFLGSLFLLSALASGGCDGDNEHACTLSYLAVLTGDIRDSNGSLVTPDRVERVGPGSTHVECELRLGAYTCGENTAGKAKVVVTLGEQTWREPIVIRDDRDGCHNVAQELDFVLTGLTPCDQVDAIQGALIDASGDPLANATVNLKRTGDQGSPWLVPETHCNIEQGRYSCPAINYYADGEFELTLKVGDGQLSVKLALRAEDCHVETVQHDFDLRTAELESGVR